MNNPVLQSPGEVIQQQLKAMAGEPAEIQPFITESAPAIQQTEPVKTEAAKVEAPVVAATMATISDEPATEVSKPEPVSDEPREGEKPAQFIKRLKAERDELRNQLKQSAEVKIRTAEPSELDALRKEIAERDTLLEQTAFERSATFRKNFAEPIKKATDSAKALISTSTDTKGVFERAMVMDANERAEYLEAELGPVKAATALMKLERIDELSRERDAAIENASARREALSSEQENQGSAQVLKAFEDARDSISKRLSIYRGEQADTLAKQARSLLSGDAAPQDIIDAAYLAAAAPHYIEMLKKANAELAIYKARDAKREGDSASIAGRGGDSRKGDGDPTYVNGSLPSIKDVIGRQLASMRG
jgi:hypothetical protein